MTLTNLIEECYKINRNKHIHNGDVFYINCHGYGSIRRSGNEYYVSTGILENFKYHKIKDLSYQKKDHLYMVIEKVLKNYE